MAASTHVVRSGDTLGRIAQQAYGDPGLYVQLAKYNNISNPNLIFPGQVIRLPPKADLVKGPAGGGAAAGGGGGAAGGVAQVDYSLYVRRYAPFPSFGGGFEGDNRAFSTSLKVTSRTVGVATFGPKPGSQVSGSGYSSGSSWVGPWEVRKDLPLGSIGRSIGQVRVTLSNVKAGPNQITFTLYTEGNLPFKDILLYKDVADVVDKINSTLRPKAPRLQGTPDIDTFVDFTATFDGAKVLFEGVVRGDGFPNAEVFVLDPGSKAVALLDYRTKSSEAGPIYRLFGAHPKNQLAAFRKQVDLNPDGSFGANAGDAPLVVQEH